MRIQNGDTTQVIYLACPYTHADPLVREKRFHQATLAAAHLIESGLIVYSPITMTHPIDVVLAGEGETLGSEYWVRFDEAFMEMCTRMLVLKLAGWEASNGIRREMEWFRRRGRPIEFLEWSAVEARRSPR